MSETILTNVMDSKFKDEGLTLDELRNAQETLRKLTHVIYATKANLDSAHQNITVKDRELAGSISIEESNAYDVGSSALQRWYDCAYAGTTLLCAFANNYDSMLSVEDNTVYAINRVLFKREQATTTD